jgi:hypothetical protein
LAAARIAAAKSCLVYFTASPRFSTAFSFPRRGQALDQPPIGGAVDSAKKERFKSFRGFIVCTISDSNFSKRRIERAYVNLLCLPDGDQGMISLAWIGNYEIRMRDVPQTGTADEPLFMIELFDHDAQSLVETRMCYEIEQGAAVFEAFVSR